MMGNIEETLVREITNPLLWGFLHLEGGSTGGYSWPLSTLSFTFPSSHHPPPQKNGKFGRRKRAYIADPPPFFLMEVLLFSASKARGETPLSWSTVQGPGE